MPLNMGNLIALAIPTVSGGGGGVDEDGFDVGEVGDGVDGGGTNGMHCFINRTALLGENTASSSSLSCKIEIRELFSNPSIPR